MPDLIYVETAIVAVGARGQGGPNEVAALRTLLDAHREKRLILITSIAARQEINKVPEQHQPPHWDVYRQLVQVAATREVWTGIGLLLKLPGLRRFDPQLMALRRLLDAIDARHVFQAIKSGAKVFLTLDRGIIHRRRELEKLGIRVLRPSELVAELEAAH